MNETDEMFDEVQNVGMTDVGTAISFQIDGKTYNGTIGNTDTSTEMLSGGYQGRTFLTIIATRSQFATAPAQRGPVTVTQPSVFNQNQWQRRQVDQFGATHYAITIYHQLSSQ